MIQDAPAVDTDIEAIRTAQLTKKVRGGDDIDADIESMRVASTPVSPWTLGFRRLSDEDIETGYRDLMALRGFREAIVPEDADTPLLGPGFVAYDAAQVMSAAGKMQTGRATVDDERIVWRAMIEQARTTTSGGTFAELAKTVVTSGAELLAGAGVAGVGAIATRKAAQAGLKKFFSEWVEKQAQAAIEKRIGEIAVDTGIDLTTASALKEGAKAVGKGATVLATTTALQEAVPQAAGALGAPGVAQGGAWTVQAIKGVLGSEMTDEEAQKVADDWHAAIPMLVEKGGGLMDGMIRQSIQMGSEAAGFAVGGLPVIKQVDQFFGAMFKFAAGRGVTSASKLARAMLFNKPGAEVGEEFLAAVGEAAIMGDKPILEAALEVAEITPEMLAAFSVPGGVVAGGVRLRDMAQRGGPKGVTVPAVGAPEASTGASATEGGDPTQAAPAVAAEGVAASVGLAPEVQAADVEAFARDTEKATGSRVEFRAVDGELKSDEVAAQRFLRRFGVETTVAEAPEGADLENLPAAFYPGEGRAVILRGQPGLMGAAVHEGLHTWEAQQTPERRAEFGAALKEISPEFMGRVEAFVRAQPLYKNASPELLAEEMRTNVGTLLGGLTAYITTPAGMRDLELAYGKQPGPIRRVLGALYDWIQDKIRLLPQRQRALARARLRVARNEGDPALVAQRVLEALREIRPVRAQGGEATSAASVSGTVVPGTAAGSTAAAEVSESVSPRPPKTPADRRANREARKAKRDGTGLGPDQGMRFAARFDPEALGRVASGGRVDGRLVRDDVPNMDSIGASLDDYEILPGVREVPMASLDPDFVRAPVRRYSPSEQARVERLAEEIRESGEITPLIVVDDGQQYPYILEGGHRLDALKILGAKSFPAVVVRDETDAAPEGKFAPRPPKDALVANFLEDAEIVDIGAKSGRALSDEFLSVQRWQRAIEALATKLTADPISSIRRFFGKIAYRGKLLARRERRIENLLREHKIERGAAGRHLEAVHTREAREKYLADHIQRRALADQRRAMVAAVKNLPRDAQFEADLRALEKRIADLAHVPIVIPDGHTAEHYFHEVAEMTGMKTSEAKALVEANAANPGFEAIRREVRALNKATLDGMLADQLISQEQYDNWTNLYRDYVPLRTAEMDRPEGPRSSGFSVRGPESKRRKGRKSEASNPLVMSIIQARNAITRGEKNAVGLELRAFLQEQREFVDSTETQGDVERGADGAPVVPADSFYMKVQGKDTLVRIENKDVTRALKRLGLPQIPSWLRLYASAMATWKLMTTALVPDFMARNFARDVPTGLINVGDVIKKHGLDGTGLRRSMAKGLARAARTVWQSDREKAITTGLGQHVQEWEAAGGRIGSFAGASFAELDALMEEQLSTGIKARAKRLAAPPFKLIEDANGAIENATRFSLYVALRERGVSIEDSALAARQLTVDFNQKGEWGTALSMGYAFFSASVGGTRRMYEAMRDSGSARAAAAGIVALGVIQALVNDSLSDDDEDGVKRYAKIPDHDKERYLILMLPGAKEPLKLIMPWGYNFFHNVGRLAAESALGYHSASDAAGKMALAAANAFSPMGTAPSVWQLAAPTFVDPFVQITENQNFTGSPIAPAENPFDVERPEHLRHFRGTQPEFVAIARMLNNITGGDDVKPGAINYGGDHVEHLAEFMGSGVARFVGSVARTMRNIGAGTPLSETLKAAPFIKDVYGARTEFVDQENFYGALEEIEYQKKYVQQAVDAGDREAVREMRERYQPTMALEKRGERVKKRVKALKDRAYESSPPSLELLNEANLEMQRWYRDYRLAAAGESN